MFGDLLIFIIFVFDLVGLMAIHILSQHRALTREDKVQKLTKKDLEVKDESDGTKIDDEHTETEINTLNTKEAEVAGKDILMNMTREKGVGPDTRMIVTEEKAVGPDRNIVETVDKRTGSNSSTIETREIGVMTDAIIILANESWAEAVEIEQANDFIEETPSLRTPTDVRPNSNQPKPMKQFPEQPLKYHPVLLLNQLHPRIKYDDIMVNDQPFFFRVFFDLLGEQFEGYGPTKKEAKKEACISAINHFYNFNYYNYL